MELKELTEDFEILIVAWLKSGDENATNLAHSLAKYAIKKQLPIHGVSKRLSIKLEDWHYQCGDGCCDMYGTEIALNDKVCDNQYAGDDVRTALEFVLTELGYEVDIDVC